MTTIFLKMFLSLISVLLVGCHLASAIFTKDDHQTYLDNVDIITRYMDKSSDMATLNKSISAEVAYQQDQMVRTHSITFFMEIIYEANQQLQLIGPEEFASRYAWFSLLKQAEAANDTISSLMSLDKDTLSKIYIPYDYSHSLKPFKKYYTFFNPKEQANRTETMARKAYAAENSTVMADELSEVLWLLDDMKQEARRVAAKAELIWIREKDRTLEQNIMPALELQYFVQYVRWLGHSIHLVIDPYISAIAATLEEIELENATNNNALDDKKNSKKLSNSSRPIDRSALVTPEPLTLTTDPLFTFFNKPAKSSKNETL